MYKKEDIEGKVINNLRIIKKLPNNRVEVECLLCGNKKIIKLANIIRGSTKACGCRKLEGLTNYELKKKRYDSEGYDISKQTHTIFRNNTSGYRGISYIKEYDTYRVYITYRGKRYELGCHRNLNEAIKVRKKAEVELWKNNPEINKIEKANRNSKRTKQYCKNRLETLKQLNIKI